MPLIVVQGHNTIVITSRRLAKQRIGRQGIAGMNALGLRCTSRRENDPRLFVPKESMFSSMRVQRGDTDSRFLNSEQVPQRQMGQSDGFFDLGLGEE